jgi:tetratricopeptide (TPR) repeat protein
MTIAPDDPPLNDSENNPLIAQNVTGDRNQLIAQMLGGTAIGNVEKLIQYSQAPKSPEVARHSLLTDPKDFIGRETEIGEIEAELQEGWGVAIAGMAGVGKSTLALHIAHRLKVQYPGGQIYLDLRGADTQPLTVESALESLLRALGIDPAQMPPERSQQAALYRSRVAQQPTLILLDDAADARQVRELLPGAGACLITSRRQMDGLEGIKFHNLAAPSEAEAVEMLTRKMLDRGVSPQRVQAEPEAVRAIATYCGRLPLALRIAAGTLKTRSWQGKRLADYAQQLADERQRLNHLQLEDLDIRANFELSYRELDPESATLFGWLGLLPEDFGLEIVQALVEHPPEAIQTTVANLVDQQLLDPFGLETEAEAQAEVPERYRMHDLMRLFALEKLEAGATSEAMQAAKVRLVQWCHEVADFWATALNPVRRRQLAEALIADWVKTDPERSAISLQDLESGLFQYALIGFESERKTLVQAVDWATETHQESLSVALAADLAPFFGLRGYWGDWVNTHQQALTAARRTNDARGEGQTLNNLGNVYRSQGKWKEAIALYEQFLQICRSIGDVQGEGQSLSNLGNMYQFQGKWDEAIALYEQSLQICRSIGDVQGEGQSLSNLGTVYRSQGKWDEAIVLHEQSLQICRAIGDVQGEGQSLSNLGVVYDFQSKWDEAIALYEQSLQVFRAIGDVQGEGQSLSNLGVVYYSQGKWNEAIDFYEQSLRIFRAIGDVHGEGESLSNLGSVYNSQGKWNEAIDFYEQSLQIFRATGDVPGEGQTLNNLGTVYRSQGKWNEAIDLYEQDLQICQAIGDVHGEGQTLNNLGNVYNSQGKWNEAIAFYEQSLQIFRAIGDVHGEGQSLSNLGTVYNSQSKWNEAIAFYEQSLQIQRAIGDVPGEGKSFNGLGNVYASQRKWKEAIDFYEQDLQIKRAIGDIQGEGQTLNNLGVVYNYQGKWEEAIAFHEQSLQIKRAIGDVQGEGQTLNNLGNVFQSQRKWSEAIAFYEQSLQIKRAIGDVQGEDQTLGNLGKVYAYQGQWNEAIDRCEQSLQIKRTIGDVHGEGLTLCNLGRVYVLQKNLDRSKEILGEALTKLHPDSPEHATVTQWLRSADHPRRSRWSSWLLPLAVLLFLLWNLLNGHGFIALGAAVVLVLSFLWPRLRRRR